MKITEMLQMGLDPRKSVLEVFLPDQAAKLQRLCRILKTPYIKSEVNILSKKRITNALIRQAGVRFCCSHTTKSGLLAPRAYLKNLNIFVAYAISRKA